MPFKDDAIAFSAWGELKATGVAPYGSLPFMTLADGTKIGQTRSIQRLVGKCTSLYPEDPIQASHIDAICDAADDLVSFTNPAGQGLEQEAKEAARLAVASEGGKTHSLLKHVNAQIEALGSNGFCVGDGLTMADLSLFVMTGMLASGFFDGVPTTVCDEFAAIQKVRKTVGSLPEVMAWYDDDESYHAQSAPGKVLKACRDI